MDRFVEVAVKATGKKQRIPAHWLDHPILGAGFKLSPSSEARHPQPRQQEQAATTATAATDDKE